MLATYVKPSGSFPRARADLEWMHYADEGRWVVRDPIDGRFFSLSETEQLAVSLMNGKRSTREVVSAMDMKSQDQTVSLIWVDSLVAKLSAAGLVWHGGMGSTAIADPPIRKTIFFLPIRLANGIAGFKVPLLDPTFLAWLLEPIAIFLFNRWTVIAVGILATVCTTLCTLAWLRPLEFGDRSIDLFQSSRWWIIVSMIVLIKIMHELGHLLACIRWNVHCREIGVLVLFFTPCPYCDTTEAWKLKSKWQRAMIAAGGIYIEVIFACIASIFWLNAEGPLEKSISAWIMVLCSIGTIAVNGNPCLKYDGYYILADLWRVPNLAQQSQLALWQCFVWGLGGSKPDFLYFSRNFFLLAGYAFISGLYRFTLMLTIVWILWTVLVPIGLGAVAFIVTVSSALGVVLAMKRFAFQTLAEFFRSKPIKLLRFLFAATVLVSICSYLLLVPVSTFVRARGFLDLKSKDPVYVTQDSLVEYLAKGNGTLQEKDRVVVLKSFDKAREQLFIESDLAEAKRKYKLLSDSKSTETTSAYELPALLEYIRELELKNEIVRQELRSLSVSAPNPGAFYPETPSPANWLTSGGGWKPASPLCHDLIQDAWLTRGTLIGWLARNNEFRVQTIVPETEVRRLKVNLDAEFMFDSDPDSIFQGKVLEIATESIDRVPRQLEGDRSLSVLRDERGELVTETPHFLVTIQIKGQPANRIRGALVSVRFRVESCTIVDWAWRYLRMAFRIPLRPLNSSL
jgi:putative peptide zinc metalloprotease protein